MHRDALPQLKGDLFLTDGGIETTLIFQEGLELPQFAAFDLLKDDHGREALRRYFTTYSALAAKHDVGLVLESPTWRANPDWGRAVGYTVDKLADANRRAISLMEEIREAHVGGRPVVISGCVGPQGDGYDPAGLMSAQEAQQYHAFQVATFADTAADMVTAITMTYADEAIGVARAAAECDLPVAISFTVETDGSLPDGQALGSAVEQVDEATDRGPAYYMINCAHPTHFDGVIVGDWSWLERIRGLRPNASTMSHAELDDAPELDDGDPGDLGQRIARLRPRLPNLTVIGGCCGTDHRHIDRMFAELV